MIGPSSPLNLLTIKKPVMKSEAALASNLECTSEELAYTFQPHPI